MTSGFIPEGNASAMPNAARRSSHHTVHGLNNSHYHYQQYHKHNHYNRQSQSQSQSHAHQQQQQQQSEHRGAVSSRSRLIISLCALIVFFFIAMLDATAVSPALPAIAQSLNVPLNGQIVWTYCGFLLTSCVFQPILGTISEIPSVGVKYTLLFTMSCFTIGTIMSGAAESLPVMVIGRVVQGIGAAGMFSKAMYMVVRLTNLRNAVVAMSWMGVPYIVGSVMGPVVGGVICKGAGSWRWTFYAAVPIAMVVLTMVIMFVWSPTKQVEEFSATVLQTMSTTPSESVAAAVTPATVHYASRKSATAWSDVDFVGGILIFTALTLLSLGLLWAGSSFSWTHPYTLACLALSGCAFVGFAVYEAFGAKSPMFHQRKLLLHRNLFVSCILNIFLGAGLFCTLMYTPVYYQTNRADNAADSGMRLSPMLISAAIGSCVNSLIVAKFNIYRIPVVIAYAMLMVGHGLMVLWDVTGQQSADFEMSALIILGLGYGIATGGTIVSGIVGLHPSDICPSLAVLSFCRSLGGILGIVTSTATIVNTVIGKLGSLSPPETAARLVDTFKGHLISLNTLGPGDIAEVRIAMVKGFHAGQMVMAMMFGLGLLASLFLMHVALPSVISLDEQMENNIKRVSTARMPVNYDQARPPSSNFVAVPIPIRRVKTDSIYN